ncbi:MAG: hypothetical protein RBR82_06595 [Pseudomonas sp.]|nr:hypothetical protein [Pseudomonas sp.]
MKRLIAPLLVLIGLLYPFAVYYGLEYFSPRGFALILGGVWGLRAVYSSEQLSNRWQAAALLIFCAVLFVFDSSRLLQWYPVLVNVLLLTVFVMSLYSGSPIIERLARLRQPELPAHAIIYTRQVTQVWAGFFLLNALLAAALTLWAPLSWWMLYNGFIAYILIGLLFAIEWLVRQRVKNAHELD